MTIFQLTKGQRVHYKPDFGPCENGIVKSFDGGNNRVAWVVYKCDGQWNRYADFTGCATPLEDLHEGWV